MPWLEEQAPEVVCLQEIKCLDGQFPLEPIEELGYTAVTFGQKTYNGVAILSRLPLDDVIRGFPGDGEDAQRRVIGATVEDVLLLNLYVVNGKEVGSDKYAYKLAWLEELRAFVAERYDMGEKVVLTGDFNVTFDDRDVYDPDEWREKILCSTPEREALGRVMECGLHDALRKHHDEGGIYTWWDFRTRAYRRGNGLRIDHFLVSEPALQACTAVEVDLEAREGEKPSDHAPVIATFE